jgi:outer membrane immunogenic protein
MRVKFVTLGSALVLAALSSSAFAADMAAEAQAVHNWSGVYVGIVGGLGFGDNVWRETGGGVTDADSFSGALGGATIGYNIQSGSWVFGAEADISAAKVSADSTTSGSFFCAGSLSTCSTDLSWIGTVRGRVGYAYGATLPFVTGGFAIGKVTGVTTNTVNGSDTLTGWTLGAGLEHAFSSKLSAKLEYLYTDLGTLSLPDSCGTNCTTDVKFSTVRVGLNYKF